MRQTIEGIKRFAERCKWIVALISLFLSGALIMLALCVWYFDGVVNGIIAANNARESAYMRDIERVRNELQVERHITRKQLDAQAADVAQIVVDIAQLWKYLDKTATTAGRAARAADSAASAAARAAIRATVTPIEVLPMPEQDDEPPQVQVLPEG